MNAFRMLVVVCLASWPLSTLAQTGTPSSASFDGSDPRAEASAHFRRGVELFQEGAFRPSLVEFQRAYEISPDYRLLYNIAQAQYQVHDYLGAAQSYEAYLAQGGSSVPENRRAQVEEVLSSLSQRVGRVEITVSRDGADVYMDDTKIGTSPIRSAVLVNLGRHRVLARSTDGAYAAQIIEVAGGDVTHITLKPNLPSEGANPAAGAPTARADLTPDWSARRKVAVTSWSLAAALLAGGIVSGVYTEKADDHLDRVLADANPNRRRVSDARARVRGLMVTSDVLFGAAAVAAVTGTVLWVLDVRAEKKPESRRQLGVSKVRLDVGVASLGLRGQF